jgi:S1-C subfamily serine protease
VLEGVHGRSPRTISLEVHDVPSIAGGGANIGIDLVGLSSTGVFVGGISKGSSAEGSKVKAGDQILEVNGRKIGIPL